MLLVSIAATNCDGTVAWKPLAGVIAGIAVTGPAGSCGDGARKAPSPAGRAVRVAAAAGARFTLPTSCESAVYVNVAGSVSPNVRYHGIPSGPPDALGGTNTSNLPVLTS